MFADITVFRKAVDYLPLINGAINTDLIVIMRVVLGQIKSKTLKEWYKKYGLAGVLADVLSITIGVIIVQLIYPLLFSNFNIFIFAILAVIVQVVHDLLFAQFFNWIPRGKSEILDTFKDYAKELGPVILLADAAMMVTTVFLTSFFASFNEKMNTIFLIINLYLVPYFLYSI
jgi:uncharacterized protein YacL